MNVALGYNLGTTATADNHAYVCQKIGAHDGPIPRRVLLSAIQTDIYNPFSRRTLHRDLMSTLCDLESAGAMVVGASGLELNSINLPNI